MSTKTKKLSETSWVKLFRQENLKAGKKRYVIVVQEWEFKSYNPSVSLDELRYHFDPAGNRGSRLGNAWRFKSRAEAEELVLLALLKWIA